MPATFRSISHDPDPSLPPAAVAGTYALGDLTVNRLGFGAMRLTAAADGSPRDRADAVAVVRRAVEWV